MRRVTDVEELLDGPLGDPRAVRGNLRDLERVNRWLGGVDLSAKALDALGAGRDEVTLLDVGTGSADIPLALIDQAMRKGRRLRVTGIDHRAEILDAAAGRRPSLAAMSDLELRVGDGQSLPYPDRAFDVAHASLVVHHLAPDEAVRVLIEMGRVARLGVVINDLVRSWPAWIGAWCMSHLLTTNRYTRHDAPLSVRRAYTEAELTALLAAAGLRVEQTVRGLVGHRVALVARPVNGRGGDRW